MKADKNQASKITVTTETRPKSKLKQFLHKFFKIFIIFMLATGALNLIIFAVIYGNHKSKLKKEVAYLNTPGHFVDVDGHSIHIIDEGNVDSEVTLLFLHSADVSDDSVALRPMFNELKDDYRIVFVERSGVGFSESRGIDKNIDNMLEETRTVLDKAGVEGPFVVVPVGTAGLEVIHWANKYPDEIEAVIGINMTYPEQYADITTEEYCGFFDYLLVPFYSLGGQRFMEVVYPSNEYGVYTETQMLTRRALVSKVGFTKDMYNENLAMVDNANKVAEEGWPEELNMYLIYANPLMEPYRSSNESVNDSYQSALEENSEVDYITEYNRSIRDYFADKENITVEEMGGPARLYTYDPKNLADKVSGYIEKELLQ
ncbi:MAG: hypothetical protein IJX85_10020 [Lachnospiraceae bacterium]|nr:hypothetical protein [Lachnospiraceae bacterium]